jgi:hypothetical protein
MSPAFELGLRLDPSLIMELAGFPSVDPWQRAALRSEAKRLLLLAARQTGESTTTSLIALHAALFRPGSLVLLVSRSERQAVELFRKLMAAYDALGRPVEVACDKCGWSEEDEYEEGVQARCESLGEDYRRLLRDLGDAETVDDFIRAVAEDARVGRSRS